MEQHMRDSKVHKNERREKGVDILEIKAFERFVESLQGDKMVTLVVQEGGPDERDDITIDVHGDVWGYEPRHKQIFEARLVRALLSAGGITVRHFLEGTEAIASKEEYECPGCGAPINGDHHHAGARVPMKALYGFFVHDGIIEGISSDDMEQAHNTDRSTGRPLRPEFGVIYADSRHWRRGILEDRLP